MTTRPKIFKYLIFSTATAIMGIAGLATRWLAFSLIFLVFIIDPVDLKIRSQSLGYWLHLSLLLPTSILFAYELLMVVFFPADKRHYYYPQGLQSIAALPSILIFGFSLYVVWRRVVDAEIFTGHFYIPFLLLLFSSAFLYAWVSGRFLVWRRIEIPRAEFGRLWHRPSWTEGKQASLDGSNDVLTKKHPLEVKSPQHSFKDVHGYGELKGQLLAFGRPVVGNRSKELEPRNGILLSGDPGNGKTYLAQALAGELKVKLLAMDYSKVVSKWVGETPENIAAAFEQAKQFGPCVLFIDEIDSFVVNRDARYAVLTG